MVKTISWNDFELEGNKENLINQGWESFEPYGDGDVLLGYEDISGWIIQRLDGATGNREGKVLVKTNDDGWLGVWTKSSLTHSQFLTLSVKASTNSKMQVRYGGTSAVLENIVELVGDDKFHVYSFILDDYASNNLIIEFKNEGSFEISNIQISDANNKHLVVEKTPLENGLTRIQSWGGNADMKLKSPNFGQLAETGTDMTISLYVENNSDSSVRFSNNLAIGGVPYPDGAEYMITVPREYKGFAYLKGELVGRDVELDIRSDGNIDMIVSQPEIIEGHDLNAMLFIEDLEDGREHVKIYGATKDTKLVYKGGGAIIGEPYVIESEIENLGGQLQMETTLDSTGQVIDKGINQVNIKGTTDSKNFKIGVKLRDGTI